MDRRTLIGTAGLALPAAVTGCLDADQSNSDDTEDSDSDDGGRTPDRVYVRAEVFTASPEGETYPPDHDVLDGFEPLDALLHRIDDRDDVSDGDTVVSDPVLYGSEEREELETQWEAIQTDADGPAFVAYDDLYLRLAYVEEFDD
ncbi:hypothetical protein OB905_09510 [Halobacteria archaeon AArc-dxtr1]|nr:hypothetical protein [Halobacteria archaeon AArc-dxtr1]